MDVCIVTHNVRKGDGQGRVNYEIVAELLRQGHRVQLVATTVAPEVQDSVRWWPVPIPPLPTQLLKNQWFALRSSALAPLKRAGRTIVHVNGFITWPEADINTAHCVHAAWLRSPHHTSQLRPGPYGWYHWTYSKLNAELERHAFAQARLVVAVSEKVREELISAADVPSAKITVIANGVDTEEFRPGPMDRKALGLPRTGFLLLFVGDIRSPGKNLDTVLAALPSCPGALLAVAGDTAGSPYPALAERLGVADRVRFLGRRRDVPNLMRAADAFVFPSHYEACSLVVSEAMASGLPVITARSVGMFCRLQDGVDGLVLEDAADASALAIRITWLIDHPDAAARLSERARAVAEQLTFRAMAKRYIGAYESLAAAAPRSA